MSKNDKIFISYRRDDSNYAAGRIYDRLTDHFGEENVFLDVDSIPIAVDFVEFLNDEVRQCSVFLSIIGDKWLDAADSRGNRRIDNENDFVRIEIEAALKLDLVVVPVLIDGAEMPREIDLPEPLHPLTRRNALRVNYERFQTDADGMARQIKSALQDRANLERERAAEQARKAEEARKVEKARKAKEARKVEEALSTKSLLGVEPESRADAVRRAKAILEAEEARKAERRSIAAKKAWETRRANEARKTIKSERLDEKASPQEHSKKYNGNSRRKTPSIEEYLERKKRSRESVLLKFFENTYTFFVVYYIICFFSSFIYFYLFNEYEIVDSLINALMSPFIILIILGMAVFNTVAR